MKASPGRPRLGLRVSTWIVLSWIAVGGAFFAAVTADSKRRISRACTKDPVVLDLYELCLALARDNDRRVLLVVALVWIVGALALGEICLALRFRWEGRAKGSHQSAANRPSSSVVNHENLEESVIRRNDERIEGHTHLEGP